MQLEGEKVHIRPMVREDVDRMEDWRPFTDPLNFLWNGSPRNSSENNIWFEAQANDPSRQWYAVEDLAGRLIGRGIVYHTSGCEAHACGHVVCG